MGTSFLPGFCHRLMLHYINAHAQPEKKLYSLSSSYPTISSFVTVPQSKKFLLVRLFRMELILSLLVFTIMLVDSLNNETVDEYFVNITDKGN